MANNKPPVTPPLGKGQDQKHIKEDMPYMGCLEKEGYQKTQVMRAASYKEQKMYRVVTTDGQRHEISFDGKLLSGGHPAKRKERELAKKKAAKGK